ncbi:hypothetical protein CKO12_11260 [Chromatium okenii]|uniref:hypothetical protein n=1 Tax=Chromatium okenii TaxID=61644 RepID=UPI0019084C07|nr:hypothetical protein [Chromatium okenii]MBK1642444.1 hypothetical protein [Chromatium okenii]
MINNNFYRAGTFGILISWLLLFNVVSADPIVDSVLAQVYEGYDQKNACWRAHANLEGGYCCLQVKRQDRLNTSTEARLYLLLVGQCYDSEGELESAHVNSGMVGALVLQLSDKVRVLAGNPLIPMGSYGAAPEKWSLVKFGANDHWGWITESGYTGYGVTTSWYSILLPHGKEISEITVPFGYDDSGKCDEEDKSCRVTLIEGTLEIDSSKIEETMFPLKVRLEGKKKGKQMPAKTWVFPFDTNSWSYQKPKGFPDLDG